MRRIALVVAYDGTDFHGWQRQPGQRTVQGVLETALDSILDEQVRLTGAGRTDAGVHARGQVASFATRSKWPARAFAPRLARALPGDVRVRAAHEVPADFDARRSAVARRYAYRLLREDDVLMARHAWRPRAPWKPDAWSRATRALEGRHDCASFESAGSPSRRTECRIARADWSAWEGGVRLDIIGDHFLYHMVRNVVGTALVLADEPDPAAAMRAVVAACDRAAAGPCAPPEGLTLEQVFYPEGGPA